MFDEIIEQLRDYCECIGDLDTDNIAKRQQVERNLTELIRLVSILTCWASGKIQKFSGGCCCENYCDSFLMQPREEVFEPEIVRSCTCGNGIVKVSPYYRMIRPETITVSIHYRNGIELEEVPVGEYSFDPYEETLWIDLSEYLTDSCDCREIVRVVVNYEAGFERLPECLLPVFCEMLQYMNDMNRCNCESCSSCEMREDSEEPDEKNQKDVWFWVRKNLYEAWSRQLEMISLCQARSRLWGAVI